EYPLPLSQPSQIGPYLTTEPQGPAIPPYNQEYVRERETTFGSGTLHTATINADTIVNQPIQGVNAVRLLGALRAALTSAHYTIHRRIEQTVRDDEVTVTLEPVPSGEFSIRHRVIAHIQSDSKNIEIQISSIALDADGRPINARVRQSEAEAVF